MVSSGQHSAATNDPIRDNVNPEGRPVLQIRGLSKTFGVNKVLERVSLDIDYREIHALIGHNGSGKSTLVKTLAGFYQGDPGSTAWCVGEPVDLTRSGEARHHRLRFVHQDLGLVLEMSATENLALSQGFRRRRSGGVDWPAQRRQTARLLERFGVAMDTESPLTSASPVERTVVAMAAALQGWDGGAGVLVMDEPTAVLPPTEVSRMFDIVRELRSSGTSVLYISHRLDEIFEIADRVTVLRAGRVVANEAVARLNPRSLATLMVGEDVDPDRRVADDGRNVRPTGLSVQGLQSPSLAGVSFSAQQGEVLGLAGLAGSGASDVPYALAGAYGSAASGFVRLAGAREWTNIADVSKLHLPLVPADRAREGLVGDFSVSENISLTNLHALGPVWHLDRKADRNLCASWIGRLNIRGPGPQAAITQLSGGNQQKVVIARCLTDSPTVLLACEPTAGVDIGSRLEIYELIAAEAARGVCVLVACSDVAELAAICTRVLVFNDGHIVDELSGDRLSRPEILHALEGSL